MELNLIWIWYHLNSLYAVNNKLTAACCDVSHKHVTEYSD